MRESYSAELWRLRKTIDDLNEEIQNRDKAALDKMLAPEHVQESLNRWVKQFDRANVNWSIESVERPTNPKQPWKIVATVASLTFLVLMYPVLLILRYV